MTTTEAATPAETTLPEDTAAPSEHRRMPWKRVAALDWLEFLAIALMTAFVVVQLRPGLLLNSNMDVGGDNAAHVAAVSYLVHTLIPKGQLSGWDPQWFGGFPLYVFYFPLPAVFTAILSHVVNYAAAFKLVSVLGVVTLPGAAYLFGRLAGFRRPTPVVMAAAMLPFLFNWSYTIYGGNIASTLAGEYSFGIACSTGLLFLGCVAYSFRTGRCRWLAAVLFGVTILCHVVPALFFAAAAVVFALLRRRPLNAIRTLVPIGLVGCLLAGFWLFRFALDLRYSSSMNYGRLGDPVSQFLPHGAEITIQILAGLGLVIALARRERFAIALAIMSIGSVLAFIILPSGIVWNPRWIPFFFLSTALLAGYALSELSSLAFHLAHRDSFSIWITPLWTSIASIAVAAAYIGVFPFLTTPSSMQTPLQGWVAWNYSGYQAKSGWPEFQRIIAMLDQAGATYGCGRLDYEYTPNINNTFGSTIAEMSFPYWTNGCIGSEEGIYFESSTSTPFHFLDQAELSIQASNPVVGLPYQQLNIPDGIAHLQMTGTQYFLANSAQVEKAADADPSLVRIASTPENPVEVDNATAAPAGTSASWVLYRILNSAPVTALKYQPVVEGGLSKTAWLALGIRWYQTPEVWSVPIAESGPAKWERPGTGVLVAPSSATKLPPVQISNIQMGQARVSFDVTRTGVPVLVKIPYFPNWQSNGASSPVEVTPNDMVVVPTSRHVVLTYGTSEVDWLGRLGSLAGLGGVMLLWRPTTVPAAPETPMDDNNEARDSDDELETDDKPAGTGGIDDEPLDSEDEPTTTDEEPQQGISPE